MKPRTVLFLSQVYPPDPAAVGQYMDDLARTLGERGWRVRVLTANRGYDDPTERFVSREDRGNLSIRRLPLSSLGKKTIAHRLAGQLSFCLQALVRGLFMPRPGVIVVTTSPPMGSALGWVLSLLRGAPVVFWVMDINPDQAVAMGKARRSSWLVRAFDAFNRRVLRRAAAVVPLDRFMAASLQAKEPAAEAKMTVMPPWPMEGHLERIAHADNPFRAEHGLAGKRVLMYSGNHSVVHPLSTLLEAAARVSDIEELVFLFVGGGRGKAEVDAFIERERPTNIRSLPYEPLERIKYSLSAADIHLASMGKAMVGIVHPCKIYGAMALARPVLFLGPRPCHVTDLMDAHDFGWCLEHGDVDRAEALLRELATLPAEALEAKGRVGEEVIRKTLNRESLCGRMCALVEEAAGIDPSASR